MKKISVIYWSGTGNTEKMAESVAEGARALEAEVRIVPVGSASVEDVLSADAVALGCPSMGDEILEESEMEPFICSLEKQSLANVSVVLFGSYDWGDGKWMRDWEERMKKTGASLLAEGLILQLEPDEEGLGECRKLGETLAKA
ncbi:flavodoxin [Syntrophobotulus glycolicus DSM 8271]|uniref:Flavodoxin n=1 Tax=Syntrophobotulus glycolicus (strain DSM 8271 / FlGlyR) TaxID=645991 RepID=F0SZ63_SYNGF|nr:flavodoxin [Syntrophobotulus glycolicus]ADY57181.1 flavodoxin [Syntrophobotulus glycolicus DSM 8271]